MREGLASRARAGAARTDKALLWSLLGHGVVLLLVLAGGIVIHRAPPAAMLAIKATVVDPQAIPRAPAVTPDKAKPEQPRPIPPEPEARPVEPRIEDDRAVRERQEAEKEAAAAEARAEKARADKARAEKAEAELVSKREAARAAEEKARAEQAKAEKAKAEKARAEKEKAERAKAEQAKAERERLEKKKADERKAAELKEKAAEAAAQRDLARQIAEEERLLAAHDSGALQAYVALIRQRVERNWVKPPGAQPGLECEVQVTQIPGGTVAAVRIGRCNGDEAVRRSIEAAVLRASPLPLPDDPALFERNLLFTFKPEQ